MTERRGREREEDRKGRGCTDNGLRTAKAGKIKQVWIKQPHEQVERKEMGARC